MVTFVNMKNDLQIQAFLNSYSSIKNQNLHGRYLNFAMLKPELESLPGMFKVKEEGVSTLGAPINSICFGDGPVRILGWSQMHGNESTTTKALFDLFKYFDLNKDLPEVSDIFRECSFMILPMLNPDGAAAYTRENANGVDLNRDAELLTQEESLVLRKVFTDFDPDFCFNLHDQRTIFSAGEVDKPATLSFLAPALDMERSISPYRKRAMQVIANITAELQEYLPGQLGRFDDAFNINCTGDRFMAFNVPTILFEAGHYQEDYKREETRKYMAAAILTAVNAIITGTYKNYEVKDYEQIPENRKNFFDIILRNACVEGEKVDVAIQYQEKLAEGKIDFQPIVQLIDKRIGFYAHRNIECQGQKVSSMTGDRLVENDVVDGILLNTDNISFKIE